MITIRENAFYWLVNSTVQIALFAILAALISARVRRIKAKAQCRYYLAVLALCVLAPLINTLWHTHSAGSSQAINNTPPGGSSLHARTPWLSRTQARGRDILASDLKIVLLVLWQTSLLYSLWRFARSCYRVHCLRRDAQPISLDRSDEAARLSQTLEGNIVLESPALDDPVTIGFLHPIIILPLGLHQKLTGPELEAVLAHERAHIHRKDYLIHLLCHLACLPWKWHPGVRYLMSRISQTRELACDQDAAMRLGKPAAYAHALLRLALLCLQTSRNAAIGLGLFDGDNLENRIMTLTGKRTSLPRADLAGLALISTLLFGASMALARAVSLQDNSASFTTTAGFAGTWHWMIHGYSFATMILVPNADGFSGTVTPSRISLDDSGDLNDADPSPGPPTPVAKTKREGEALRVTGSDGFEFLVSLKDSTHAEVRPVGAPPKMKPIQLERVK